MRFVFVVLGLVLVLVRNQVMLTKVACAENTKGEKCVAGELQQGCRALQLKIRCISGRF